MPQTYGEIIDMGIFFVIKIANLNKNIHMMMKFNKFTLSI
jgi:hypothetical protein